MAKYKIVPIKHLLKNNTIASSGDIVDGSKFVNLQDALDRGICVPLKEAKAPEQKPEQNEGLNINDIELDFESVDLDSMKKKELISFCEENEIGLPEKGVNSNKEELKDYITEKLGK